MAHGQAVGELAPDPCEAHRDAQVARTADQP